MTRPFLAAVLVLLLGLPALAQLPGVKGEDDRVIVKSDDWPWCAVVKVNRRTGGFCAGVLIAPDKVLTAAHCPYLKNTDHWLGADRIHVVQNYRRGDWTDDSAVQSYVMGLDGSILRNGANASTHLDWTVLTLETLLGECMVPLGWVSPGLRRARS